MGEHQEYVPLDAVEAYDEQEVAQFWREQGIVPIDERRALLWQALGEEKQEEREAMGRATAPLVAAIEQLPQMKRLRELRQLGRKTIDRDTQKVQGVPIATRSLLHTRFEHSALISELALAAGVQMGLSQPQIETSMAAGWFHDSLHPAFSHACDHLLISRGTPDHEKRVQALLTGKNEVHDFLDNFHLDPDSIFRIIEEKGSAGTLQRILDTQSYLIVDSAATGQDFYPDQGAAFIRSLKRFDTDGQTLVVSDTAPLQQILEYRAQMGRDLYFEESNRRGDAALQQLLRIALNRQEVTMDQIEHGTDQELLLHLQSLVQYDPGAARMAGRRSADAPLVAYKKLFSVVGGMYDESTWQRRVYDTAEEAQQFLYRQTPQSIEQSFILEPYDYTKKSVTVLLELPDGTLERKRLEAKTIVPSDENLKQWVVFAPKG